MAILLRGLAQVGLFVAGFFTGGGVSGLSRLVMWGGVLAVSYFVYKNFIKV